MGIVHIAQARSTSISKMKKNVSSVVLLAMVTALITQQVNIDTVMGAINVFGVDQLQQDIVPIVPIKSMKSNRVL